MTLIIVAATLLGLLLRLYQLSRPGFLLSVNEYDDGPYFGSAVRLVYGALPYRDFLIVQPPGITLLMTPVALLSKATGTAWGMAIGRILTVADQAPPRWRWRACWSGTAAYWPRSSSAGSWRSTRTASRPRRPCSWNRGWCCSA